MFRGLILTILVVGVMIGVAMPARHARPASPPVLLVPSPVEPPRAVTRETVLSRADDGHFFADGEVNGQPVRFLVDTGATKVGAAAFNGVPAVVVADGLPISLLGQSFLNRLASVSIAGDRMTLE